MVATSGSNRTFKFPKGTPDALVEEALSAIPVLKQFVTDANQTVLQLEEGFKFLDLKAKLGEAQFRKLLRKYALLAAKEILQKLSMAELVQRVPQFYDRILSMGAEACDVLRSASDDLAARILAEAARCTTATISVLKTLVRRESFGYEPLPSKEEVALYQPSTLVEIVKGGQLQGWVAEVTAAPDALGRLSVRLLKTCRKRTFFLHEVKLYSQTITPDPNAGVTDADWEAIAANYVFPAADGKYVVLSNGDIESLKETAEQFARSHALPEATEIVVCWKHALSAVEQYGLVAAIANIAGASSSSGADSSPSDSIPSAGLIAALAAARKMKATLTEELNACVTDDARDLLRQKLRYVEREIENILSQLCGGSGSGDSSGAFPDITFGKVLEEKDAEIGTLRSEVGTLREMLQQLQLRVASTQAREPQTPTENADQMEIAALSEPHAVLQAVQVPQHESREQVHEEPEQPTFEESEPSQQLPVGTIAPGVRVRIWDDSYYAGQLAVVERKQIFTKTNGKVTPDCGDWFVIFVASGLRQSFKEREFLIVDENGTVVAQPEGVREENPYGWQKDFTVGRVFGSESLVIYEGMDKYNNVWYSNTSNGRKGSCLENRFRPLSEEETDTYWAKQAPVKAG